jgi:hypothetical protein
LDANSYQSGSVFKANQQLAIINLATHPSKLWFIWPALGWGIGIFAHAAAIYNVIPFLGAEWERKQVEKELGRPL